MYTEIGNEVIWYLMCSFWPLFLEIRFTDSAWNFLLYNSVINMFTDEKVWQATTSVADLLFPKKNLV